MQALLLDAAPPSHPASSHAESSHSDADSPGLAVGRRNSPDPSDLAPPPPAADLLAWYDRHRRTLPWRAAAGETADPYRVWLSEIMLQQTNARTVIPYYERFLERFPTVHHLARADMDAVLLVWAGLGYYTRARNLHDCARIISDRGGIFPREPAKLRMLPGIGVYTSTAIAAIAFAIPGIPVDGNVERVAARIFAVTEPLPVSRPAIAAAAATLGTDPHARARPSDFAQALFDLGATVCTPQNPDCPRCPWESGCGARREGLQDELPRRGPRPVRPVRHGAAFWLTDKRDRVLLRRRPPTGLLGGMVELPGTPWLPEPVSEAKHLAQAPTKAAWTLAGEVLHTFTHFELHLAVYVARVDSIEAAGFLRSSYALHAEAMPSVMRKCAFLARDGAVPRTRRARPSDE